MNIIAVKARVTADDSRHVRSILKAAGIKMNVRKALGTVHIGTQCQRIPSAQAVNVITLMKAAGYLIDQEEIMTSLIRKGICDTIDVLVPVGGGVKTV